MKTFLFILFIIIGNGNLYAQNKINPPKLPRNFNDTNFYNRTQSHFLLGWNWGGAGVKMDNALHINMLHAAYYWLWMRNADFTDSTLYPMNLNRIVNLTVDTVQRSPFDQWGGGRSITFEPTLTVDTTSYFTPRAYDQDGSVFGFKYKSPKGVILPSISHTSTDYGCYILRKDSISTPTVVLDSVWNDNALSWVTDTSAIVDANGTSWWLSINLKQKDTLTLPHMLDTVLTLTMPYTWVHTDSTHHYYYTNTIQFDSVPGTTSTNITGSLGDYRGKTKSPIGKSPQTRVFTITGAMLRHFSNKIDSSLTLSAHFYCNNLIDSTLFRYNPRLREANGEQTYDHITKLGVQVKYYGNVSAAIEWIRIETPLAQRAYRGAMDSTVMSAIDALTSTLNTFGNHAKVKIHRFYAHEEGDMCNWGMMRYFNMLVDTLAVSEVGTERNSPPSLFYYATGYKQMWNGDAVQFNGFQGVPYIRQSLVNYTAGQPTYASCFNLSKGYAGKHDTAWYIPLQGTIDSLQSSYETYLHGHDETFPLPNPDTLYNNYDIYHSEYNANESIQYGIERLLYKAHFLQPSILYGTNPWWDNQWINSEYWALDTSISSFSLKPSTRKPLTGEEVRIIGGTSLLLGAKGLLYWYKTGAGQWLGLQPNENVLKTSFLTGKSFLLNDSLGGDYYKPGHDPNSALLTPFSSGVYDYTLMGIDSNHIYLGLKSIRMEIAKTNEWIYQNEAELLRMRLQAWYGKGFAKLYSQHPDYGASPSVMKTYLNYDSIKVRKLFLTSVGSLTANDTIYEPKDSTFYDVMLMRDGDKRMDSVFYIGIDNRRTDPLIYFHDTSAAAWYMKFYPTDELDSLVTSPDSARYQELWWQRLGTRKITLPFNYKDTMKRYALLKIKELGAHNTALEALASYRKNPALYKTVDTVIGQDRPLDLTLLPGEYKILKVEILRPNEVLGKLAHSNQTKIVAHAIMKRHNGTGDWEESDTIVHYMTYFKPINSDTNYTGVYFRKSKPASKYMNTAAIQWEGEHLLSQNILHDSIMSICDTCAYPSIVTRFDSTSGEYWSFVVFGCVSDSAVMHNYNQSIVESVVRVRNDSVLEFTRPGYAQYGLVLATLPHRDMKEWGTPMVNASDSINFYCWSEHSYIEASWKTPDYIPRALRNFVPILAMPYSTFSCDFSYAQHPSMNPYSRYIRGEHEKDCALVWQEKNICDDYYSIYYTRLLFENGNITNGLSPHYGADPGTAGLFNFDSTIVCMSTTSFSYPEYQENTYPVVVRELFLADTNSSLCDFGYWNGGHTPVDVRFDGVYWQMQQAKPDSTFHGVIMSRWLWQCDTLIGSNFVPDTLRLGYIAPVWGGSSNGSFFDQPVISCGEADYYHLLTGNWVGCVNYSTRQFFLEFRKRPLYSSVSAPFWTASDSSAQILHVDVTHHPVGTNPTVEIVDNGYLSDNHVAERGTVKYNDWQRNHRIYNKTIPSPPALPTIRSSGQYFFRTGTAQPTARQFYGFGEMRGSYGVSSVIISGQEYAIKPQALEEPSRFLMIPDTLSTDWFTVDNLEPMELITAGASPDRVNIWLERQSDGTTWDITLSAGEQMRIRRETVELENGDNENYRVRVCSNNHAPYHPETAITDDNEESSFSKSSGQEYKQLNLGVSDPTQTIFVYPNPARDEVNLLIKGTEKCDVIIVSAIGGEQTRFVAEGGKTAVLNTSNFSSGVYVARVRRKGMVDAVVPFIVVR